MTDERRSAPREPLSARVKIDGPKGRQQLTLRDISPGGLFVEMPRPLPLGQTVQCTIELPGGVAVEATVEVRHHAAAYHTADGAGPYRGMGLRFLRISAEGQRALGDLLAARRAG